VHRVAPIAGIDPAPVYRYARWVGQMLGVGPRLSIDHRKHVWERRDLMSKRGGFGSAPPKSQHENPIWGRSPPRINDEGSRKLTVLSKGTTGVAQFSTGACVILIRPGCTCRESQFSHFLGRNFHNRFCVSRVLMQAVHYRRDPEEVVKGHVDLGALRNADQWSGHLQRFAFFAECVHLHAWTGVGFRVPVSLP